MKKEEDIVRKRAVKAILFDLDGVLVDSFEAWFHTFNDGLKHFGLRALSRTNFAKGFGAPIESDIKKYFIGKTIEEVKNMHNSNFMKWKNYVRLSHQSKTILKNLKKKKIKLGLISNSTRFIVNAILKHYKIWEDCFKSVVDAYKKEAKNSNETLKRLESVEKRGRYRAKGS